MEADGSSDGTNRKRYFFSPVTDALSDNRFGGVWAGVWWWWWSLIGVPVNPPYRALKSSGVLLHFRWIGLSTVPWPAEVRFSCDNPSNRFSWDPIPISLLSWSDINLVSCALCWRLPCDSVWSSNRPCCSPSRPPTRFGRRSSISLPCPLAPHVLPVKFSCRLKIAGKILNCCESGLAGLSPREDDWAPDEVPLPALAPPPPIPAGPESAQLFLKSNLEPSGL